MRFLVSIVGLGGAEIKYHVYRILKMRYPMMDTRLHILDADTVDFSV